MFPSLPCSPQTLASPLAQHLDYIALVQPWHVVTVLQVDKVPSTTQYLNATHCWLPVAQVVQCSASPAGARSSMARLGACSKSDGREGQCIAVQCSALHST